MNPGNIISLLMSVILLVISLQNPVLAQKLSSMGQAAPPAEQAVAKKRIQPKAQADKDTKPVKKKTSSMFSGCHLIEQEVSEKRMIMTRLVADKKRARKLNKKFIQTVKTSDVTRLDLRKPSGLTAVQASQLLKGTGLEGLGKAFVTAEAKYHVNAYYLMAHAAWESGWGRSRLSREKNNLFGYMAFDHNPYHSAKGFRTKEESIYTVAGYISKNYLSESGIYYNGPYLQGINVKYASDGNWDKGIAHVMISLVEKTNRKGNYAA